MCIMYVICVFIKYTCRFKQKKLNRSDDNQVGGRVTTMFASQFPCFRLFGANVQDVKVKFKMPGSTVAAAGILYYIIIMYTYIYIYIYICICLYLYIYI